MLITEFYANREIFITGGTGFLGKALIEKLLRDCPKVKILYILLRANRCRTAKERLEELKKNKVFDRIRQECPQVLSKLHVIEGNMLELGLGIKANDLKLLENVSLIFHMAANVKFDDPLRSSILLNTCGTYELVKIAENFKNLLAFLYCSTAYCNALEDTVEEKVYKIPYDWRQAIKIAETYDEDTLNILFKKYTGNYPNTYTFTKNLCEHIIEEYSEKLPMVIFRPSIVMNSLKEPVAGWIDNLNGPIAGIVAKTIGVLPIAFCKPNLTLDCVPIDTVTKLTIVAAYKRGMQKMKNEVIPDHLEVINCASGEICSLTMAQCDTLFAHAVGKNPMENCIWAFDAPSITGCYYNFILNIFLINIPASLILDNILRLMGRKPMLLKITRKILYTTYAIYYFTKKSYIMENKNIWKLEKMIPDSEIEIFGGLNECVNIDYINYFGNIVKGCKENIFVQPREASDAARTRHRVLIILNKIIKLLIFIFIVRFLWLKFSY